MLPASKYRGLPRDLILLVAEAPPPRSFSRRVLEAHGLDADDDADALDDLVEDALERSFDAR